MRKLQFWIWLLVSVSVAGQNDDEITDVLFHSFWGTGRQSKEFKSEVEMPAHQHGNILTSSVRNLVATEAHKPDEAQFPSQQDELSDPDATCKDVQRRKNENLVQNASLVELPRKWQFLMKPVQQNHQRVKWHQLKPSGEREVNAISVELQNPPDSVKYKAHVDKQLEDKIKAALRLPVPARVPQQFASSERSTLQEKYRSWLTRTHDDLLHGHPLQHLSRKGEAVKKKRPEHEHEYNLIEEYDWNPILSVSNMLDPTVQNRQPVESKAALEEGDTETSDSEELSIFKIYFLTLSIVILICFYSIGFFWIAGVCMINFGNPFRQRIWSWVSDTYDIPGCSLTAEGFFWIAGVCMINFGNPFRQRIWSWVSDTYDIPGFEPERSGKSEGQSQMEFPLERQPRFLDDRHVLIMRKKGEDLTMHLIEKSEPSLM
ncbi:unnamed protein product [Cyprideis torosa]|uniref:Uncharacterized protein n=1 Tax=Cyprideis torosa TaxID=163714 RepID=A0A7R8WB34_9CRUS|nr:unnamed protein product [Cyprideis torosa]CAG0891845.1 unnamed protein product [Cyprideis torosa]